ncbi:tyrosine-type recombinase/integrase [Thermodesulfobacteriota bacterium]
MGTVYKRGDTWWIRYRQNGKNKFESAKSKKKTVAVKLLRKREGRIEDGKDSGAGYDKVTYENLRQDIVNDYKINGQNIERLENSLNHLDEFFTGLKANMITTSEVKAYTNMRLDEEAKNGTINRELAALKRMFKLGCQGDTVSSVPYIPMLKEGSPRKGFFEHDEYLALLEKLPPELRSVVTFAYRTGWRKEEILGLTWDKVNLKDRTIILNPEETKNKTGRLIYMDKEIYSMLRLQSLRRKKNCNYVFNRKGKRIKDFRGAWKKACKDAELSGKVFHDFRRTAVRNLTRSGVQETVAMKFTGHKTRAVFDRYNITSQDDLREATERQDAYLKNQSF